MSDHTHNHAPTTETAHETHHDDAHAEVMAETTTLLGRTLPFPLYTVIFGILGILTVAEIVIAELFSSWVKIVVLLAFAIAKAALVVIYYMHLKTDSKIFTLVLLLPVFIVTISLMFLLIVPYGSAY
ncbi:MAG: cytochrome C oxidase subunit IV family protein [Anaerolineae bacterium]|jgi:caa(3)-type oxidase subunit IV|nr:cytochrome C oxidase subunit IV family protein [Anaerolineae bacterium]